MKRVILMGVVLFSLLFLAVFSLEAKDIGYYLELGQSYTAGEYTLKEGVITVEQKGTPVDGLQIIIPAGSYPEIQKFTVSYTVVKKAKVRDYVLSPLISITGPERPADGMLIVKIPCKVPSNSMAMVFFYDEQEKFTQGLPPAPRQEGYVTAMTRVLKDMVVVATKMSSRDLQR